jgi:hypothetical protein
VIRTASESAPTCAVATGGVHGKRLRRARGLEERTVHGGGGLRRQLQRELARFGDAHVLAHQPLRLQPHLQHLPAKPAGTCTGTGSSSVPS